MRRSLASRHIHQQKQTRRALDHQTTRMLCRQTLDVAAPSDIYLVLKSYFFLFLSAPLTRLTVYEIRANVVMQKDPRRNDHRRACVAKRVKFATRRSRGRGGAGRKRISEPMDLKMRISTVTSSVSSERKTTCKATLEGSCVTQT